jgi:hypothetical protein
MDKFFDFLLSAVLLSVGLCMLGGAIYWISAVFYIIFN